ncbi:hypothetical protein [Streptomyces erythrochromogenes]|uniref:hypothetical protein n=1 Tax=Streptomyces erythrochromogenes TaxID=285574 RepID=UPI00381FE6A8
MRRLPVSWRRLPQALGLRWKIAVLLAVGCSLVAVAVGLLIHGARARQIGEAARASATVGARPPSVPGRRPGHPVTRTARVARMAPHSS